MGAFRERYRITEGTDARALLSRLKAEGIPYSVQVKKDDQRTDTYLIISSKHAVKVLFLMKKYIKRP
ncbi:MAG: hypothetical protein K6G61_06305 [Solobacterium sp.]|nr:hypothetical protein [Solobacterium sp.]